MSKLVLLVPVLTSLALAGCASDLDAMDDDAELTSVSIETSGLEPLAGGFLYEGWAIIDGAPVSFGKFNVDLSGTITDPDGIAIPGSQLSAGRDLSTATDIVITVEPAVDNDIVPSESKMLGGALASGQATLTTAHAGTGFASDFADATGRFILATPTSASEEDETSGVWFLDLSSNPPIPGLMLPELGEGWAYEGWVVFEGQDGPVPVSTGTFLAADMPDDFDVFSGPLGGPAVPGEDLVANAPEGWSFPTDLSGRTVVISVEPVPDDSPAPFVLKPLAGDVPDSAADHQTLPMTNIAGGFPTMEVTLVP
ncbi:MAG: hypothetical protein KJO07_25395 [Deltaproteobacteria bacterium]|nr:hypothetical protein [Deltaproteobacteria bacterium]